jgi:methyltransferase (TIGR00027 family)
VQDTHAPTPDSTAVRVALWRALHVEVDPPPHVLKDSVGLKLAAPVPNWLRPVPVDFEAGGSWWERLTTAGFDVARPTVVASSGVSMYLTKEAITATLLQTAALTSGSALAMTFLLPLELTDPEIRPGLERAVQGARASGTPFISFFTPAEMLALARETGFRDVRHVSAADLTQPYFAGRADGLRPPNNAEELLVATTG